MRTPPYSVTLCHMKEDGSVFGISDEIWMNYPGIEMMLRLADPMKSVEWCGEVLNIRRRAFIIIKLETVGIDGKRTMKFLKITRN